MQSEILRLQENLSEAVKERDNAVAALDLFVNENLESPISYVEEISLDPNSSPVIRTRYVQSPDNVSIIWAGVSLRLTLKQDFVELSYNGCKDDYEQIAMVPRAYQQIAFINKDNMR